MILNNPVLSRKLEEHLAERQNAPREAEIVIPPFTCDVETSPTVPTSVHQLRPSDVDVIGVLGDSISTGCGCGAKNILEVALNNRGCAYTGGGDFTIANKSTIPNIIRKFNPNLRGYAVGEGDTFDDNAWLNVAVMGARAIHMPDQVDDLIDKLEKDQLIDYQNDWKLITLFIGGNDMCGYCRDRENRQPEHFAGYIQDALDALHRQVPRMMVQIVPMFDVTPLVHMNTGWHCDVMQENFCSCAVNETTRPELRPLQLGYFQKTKELVDSGRYDTRDDFTVVLQPVFKDAKPPIINATGKYDTSLVSYDCFHPSAKMHAGMALAVWDSMLSPVGQKPTETNDGMADRIRCPTKEEPYIYTNKNSGPAVDVARKNPNQENIDKANEKCRQTKIGVVAGIGGVVLVLIVVFFIVLPLRRRHLRRKQEQKELEGESAGKSNPAFASSTDVKSHPI